MTTSRPWTPSPPPGSRQRAEPDLRARQPRAGGPGRRDRPSSSASSTTSRRTSAGERKAGGGAEIKVVQPHDHQHVLGVLKNSTAGRREGRRSRRPATRRPDWRAMPFDDRVRDPAQGRRPARRPVAAADQRRHHARPVEDGVPGRDRRACELIDFWRFNVHYAQQILADQPIANSPGIWNRTDHRPLEGFVYAITPFNFTAIAGNLPTAPALMGNTVIWKPSPTQQLGRVADDGAARGGRHAAGRDQHAARRRPRRSPRWRWRTPTWPASTSPARPRPSSTCGGPSARTSPSYRSYPRIVGETGGKDFIVAHPSADPDVLRTAMIRGAFEFQGQKCSAASRAYVPKSVWKKMQRLVPRRDRGASRWATHRLLQLHGRGHRRPGVRQAQGGDRPGQATNKLQTSWPAARSTTRSATSCGPTIVESATTRPTRCSRPSTSARSSPSTSTTTADFEKVVRRWSRSRRTR